MDMASMATIYVHAQRDLFTSKSIPTATETPSNRASHNTTHIPSNPSTASVCPTTPPPHRSASPSHNITQATQSPRTPQLTHSTRPLSIHSFPCPVSQQSRCTRQRHPSVVEPARPREKKSNWVSRIRGTGGGRWCDTPRVEAGRWAWYLCLGGFGSVGVVGVFGLVSMLVCLGSSRGEGIQPVAITTHVTHHT